MTMALTGPQICDPRWCMLMGKEFSIKPQSVAGYHCQWTHISGIAKDGTGMSSVSDAMEARLLFASAQDACVRRTICVCLGLSLMCEEVVHESSG